MRNESPTYYCAFLLTLYVLTFALSNLDGYFTLLCLETGLCREKNPLMRWALEISPEFFLLFKNFLVGFFGAVLLAIGRRYPNKFVFLGFVFVFLCYLWVIHLHSGIIKNF